MSDLTKIVKIIFEGSDTGLTSTLGDVSGKFSSLNDITNKIAAPLAKAADAVLKVDAAIAALVVGGMASAIKQSAEFNSGFGLISTSIDATGQDLADFRTNVLEYSTTSTKSIADINAAIYTAAQAGIKYGDAIEFMSSAEKLAVANKADLNTTVDLLTGTMNAYGFKISDVSKLNDVFFTSTLIGKQTIDELGTSMGNVVGIAANFGVSFEELSGAISTLTAKGMETSEAITAVKGVITAIVSPSAEAEKAASALGLTFSASALKADGLSGMLSKIMTATGGSADKMATLFSEVRALNGAMQITGDGMAFFNEAMTKINSSTGSAEEAYKKMAATFENQTQMVVNTAKVMLISVGTELEPIAAGIATSFGSLLKGITVGVDAGVFDPLFAVIKDMGTELSTWLGGIATALPEALKGLDFSKLTSAIKDFGAAFSSYLGGMDLTNVEDLHEFIQKLINGFSGLVNVTTGMVEGFKPFATAIADFLLGMSESDAESQKMAGRMAVLGKLITTTGGAFVAIAEAVDKYGLSLSGAFDVIAGGTKLIFNRVEQLANQIQLAFVMLETAFLEFINMLSLGLLGKFSDSFKNMVSVVNDSAVKIAANLKENGADASAGLDQMIEGFKKLGTGATTTKEKVKEAGEEVNNLPGAKTTTWSFEGADKIKQAIIDIGKEVVKVDEKTETTFDKTKMITVGYIEDGGSRTAIQTAVKTAVPDSKKVDVKLDTETVKKDSDIIKEAIQWKAKLDIAQVEAGTKKIQTMFESVDTGIKSTGDLLSDLFGELNESSGWNRNLIEDQIELESKLRQQEFDLQKELTEQQIALNKLKLEAAEEGKGMAITVTASGLEPHLENILWEILKKIQIRANATAAEFLLGVS